MHRQSNEKETKHDEKYPDVQQWFGTTFTNNKAGMAEVNKEKVKRVVYDMSKNTPHFKHGLRLQSQTEERIRKMKLRAQALTTTDLASHTRAMDCKVAELRAGADLTRTWIHMDMDAFFASVEELDDPSLKHKPMAVGGLGIITTANYEARKFGIRSAMPGYIGKRLCPQLVFVQPDFGKYVRAAAAVRAILVDFDADFEAGSLDEAYLDVTDYCQQHSLTGEAVAEIVRRTVREETRLTCSCGIGPNRLLSKIATDIRKPDGQYIIGSDYTAIQRFIDPLPVRKIPYIGKVTEQILKALGIQTCSDLIANRGLISALFKPLSVDFFIRSGLGFGQTGHSAPLESGAVGRRGMSVERTFPAVSSPADLEAWCGELSDKLAEDLASEGLKGRTLTLKLKETNFELRTRDKTLTTYISSKEDIFREAMKLLKPEMPIKIRLMGVGLSSFLETNAGPGQRTLAGFIQRESSGAPATYHQPETDPQGWKQTFLDAQTRQKIAKHMAEYRQWKEEHPGKTWPGHVWHQSPLLSPGAGAFWSGSTDASGRLPEPKHFWYDINEYRLNSKPHIRRILQHQQDQKDQQQETNAQAAAEPSQAPMLERQLSDSLLDQMSFQHAGSMRAADESDQAAALKQEQSDVWHDARSIQSDKRWKQAAAALGRSKIDEKLQQNNPQHSWSSQQEQQNGDNTCNGLGFAEHCHDSASKRAAADSWQPVTASQMLKRQRLSESVPGQQQPKQQQPPLEFLAKPGRKGAGDSHTQSQAGIAPQMLHHDSGPAAGRQQKQQKQQQLSSPCAPCKDTFAGSLGHGGEQEACVRSSLLLDSMANAEQLEESEQSCEDVWAMWGEAGEPGQDFAWAEPPAGMGDGNEEGSSARVGTEDAASVSGHRTWACQVCTFSDNRVQILRCAMCDTVRGTSWAYFRTTQAQASELALDVGVEPGESKGKASIQKGRRAQSRRKGIERFLL